MEALDAPLFDHLLGFFQPDDASKLAVCSKMLQGLINGSAVWKTCCEHECPSLTTSPARELVRAHCGAESDVGYKQLYAKLGNRRGDNIASSAKEPICRGKGGKVELSDYVMLMDVHVRGQALLFCSADGSEMDPSFQGRQEDWEFDNPRDRKCMAVVAGTHEPGAQERILSAFREVGRNHHEKGLRPEAPERLRLFEQDVILFSWRLMRKADGAVQALLDKEPVTVKDQGVYPNHVLCNLGDQDTAYHLRLEAKAAVKDEDGVQWDFFKTLMRLRCYFDKPGNGSGADHRSGLDYLAAWESPTTESKGFSVEVGIVHYSSQDAYDDYFNWQYVGDSDLKFLLKNVLRRWI